MPHDRIDQAAAVLNGAMHQGDGGRQARELLAFDASTMGKADFEAMVDMVQTTEAFGINDLMRQGRHEDAVCRLRENANVFQNTEEFMELAGKVRAMNKMTGSPSYIEFTPIYQNGDNYGRPTAVNVEVATTFQSPNTGQQWERRDSVTRVDNRIGEGDCHNLQAPPPVVVIAQPPPIIVERQPQFTFNLEIEIGRERIRRHDPRWCPDRNWRPHNAPPGFNLEIEIGRVRDDYRRRGDHNWSPQRPTSQTVINQINNTTIINNNTTNIDRSRTTIDNSRTTIDNSTTNNNIDRSRTRVDSNDRTRIVNEAPQNPRREVPPVQNRAPGDSGQQRRDVPQHNPGDRGQPRRELPQQNTPDRVPDKKNDADERRRDAQQRTGQNHDRPQPQRREDQQQRQRPERSENRDEKRERKKQ